VQRLTDVRTLPRLRRNPQFNEETLAKALPAAGIAYEPMLVLGGLHRPRRAPRLPSPQWKGCLKATRSPRTAPFLMSHAGKGQPSLLLSSRSGDVDSMQGQARAAPPFPLSYPLLPVP